jgi:hypothetical protein
MDLYIYSPIRLHSSAYLGKHREIPRQYLDALDGRTERVVHKWLDGDTRKFVHFMMLIARIWRESR